jgi:hypothetical protein
MDAASVIAKKRAGDPVRSQLIEKAVDTHMLLINNTKLRQGRGFSSPCFNAALGV